VEIVNENIYKTWCLKLSTLELQQSTICLFTITFSESGMNKRLEMFSSHYLKSNHKDKWWQKERHILASQLHAHVSETSYECTVLVPVDANTDLSISTSLWNGKFWVQSIAINKHSFSPTCSHHETVVLWVLERSTFTDLISVQRESPSIYMQKQYWNYDDMMHYGNIQMNSQL
jgi:hypothetical protein